MLSSYTIIFATLASYDASTTEIKIALLFNLYRIRYLPTRKLWTSFALFRLDSKLIEGPRQLLPGHLKTGEKYDFF